MAKEEKLTPQGHIGQGQSYDEALANMSIEQKDNIIKQLDRQCGTLAQENIKLRQQMQQMQQSEFYVILDWNYKVAICDNGIFNTDFRKACAKRVEEMLTPPEKEEENDEQQ